MKKYLLLIAAALFLATGCAKEFDDSEIWKAIETVKDKVTTLETLLKAHNNNLTIKVVQPIEGGFHIEFSDGSKADIISGKNGAQGPKGETGAKGDAGAKGETGAKGDPGDSVIKNIKVTEDYVEITVMLDGKSQTISFPIYKGEIQPDQPNPDDMIAEKIGYVNITDQYNVPSYMKILRHSSVCDKIPNAAIVVELRKGATMTHLGDLDIVSGREAYGDEYPVIINGSQSLSTHSNVRNGEIHFGEEEIAPCFAQNADGTFEVIWHKTEKENGKLHKIGRDGSVLVENWIPQAMVDGWMMITWDGKAQSEGEALIPGGTPTDWYANDFSCARSAVGIRKDGTLVVFVSDGRDLGLSMNELSQHMADLGCQAAVSLEGSSSPDIVINKKDMLKNKKRFDADGTLTGQSGKIFYPLPAFK